jgi:hypothetical protein
MSPNGQAVAEIQRPAANLVRNECVRLLTRDARALKKTERPARISLPAASFDFHDVVLSNLPFGFLGGGDNH